VAKNLADYLPNKTETKVIIQAKVNAELSEKVHMLLKEQNNTWVDFFTAAMVKFLEENKK
jgi:hypothetical protein